MTFLVSQRPKMIENKDTGLILAVEFKSEEIKSNSFRIKISNFCSDRFLRKSMKIVKFNFAIYPRTTEMLPFGNMNFIFL